jgi:hypothetical protein
MYLKSSDYESDFPPDTVAPTAAATTAKPEPEKEKEQIQESSCRLDAMAALTVLLISALQ